MTNMESVLSSIPKDDLQKIRERINATKINVLLVGATGVGKSSTISALFQDAGLESSAIIGQKATPETMDVSAHELDNLVIWDTPGLGDSPEKDREHQEKIIELLHRKDEHGSPLIDLVFLILDASSRDFGTAFTLIEDVIMPNMDDQDKDRLLVGLNQADNALKGRFWNHEENKPEPKLIERLDDLVVTVKERINKPGSGINVEPVYYSAGYIVDGEVLSRPYNLQKLLSFILERLPKKKRAVISTHINQNEGNFRSNDDKENYKEKVEESIFFSFLEWMKEVASGVGDELKKFATDPENLKTAAIFVFNTVVAFMKKNPKK